MRLVILFILCATCVSISFTQNSQEHSRVTGTYSIVAWDSATGDLGVAVQSTLLAVGSIVPYAKAGIGAVATGICKSRIRHSSNRYANARDDCPASRRFVDS